MTTSNFRQTVTILLKLFMVAGLLAGLVLAMISAAPAVRQAVSEQREDRLMQELVTASGAELTGVNVNGWTRVNAEAAAEIEGNPAELAARVAAKLRLLDAGRSVDRWQNQYARGVRIEGVSPSGRIIGVLGQTMQLDGQEAVSHVMVNVPGGEDGRARRDRRVLERTLQALGSDTRVAITYSGRIDKVLSREELLDTAEIIMQQAGATVRERTEKENLVSLTGFSSRLSGAISYAGQEVNLNVALRSSPADGATFVHAATPVIFVEY